MKTRTIRITLELLIDDADENTPVEQLLEQAREDMLSDGLSEYINEDNAEEIPPAATPLQKPTTVEDICNIVGCSLSEQDSAQHRIEMLLSYLSDNSVIEKYDGDRLDRIFSDDEAY